MTILERAHEQSLKWWYRHITSQPAPTGKILIFADVALGDLCFLLPVIQALKDRPHTVVCNNPDRQEVIRLLTPHVAHIDAIGDDYGTCICNFQQQWTPIIRKILKLEIPTRIGHFNLDRPKYQWVFNQKIPYMRNYHRHVVNEWLLWPFGIHHPEPVKLEPRWREKDFDVIISPFSNNGMGAKDWPGHGELAKRLMNLGYQVGYFPYKCGMDWLLATIAGSRLVIGNDSGITKLADAMGIPAIQIHLKTGPCTPSEVGVLHGHNLVDPTVQEVITLARTILEGKR